MKSKIVNLWLLAPLLCIVLFRFYFFYIDECFSDICRHSKTLAFTEVSTRVEVTSFFIYQSFPYLFYFFDLPFLFFAMTSKSITNFNRLGLSVWAMQPSYDILFLIALTFFFLFYKLKIIALLASLYIKFELIIAVMLLTYLYWKPLVRFKIKNYIPFTFLILFFGLVTASIVDISLISGPENVKFAGYQNTFIRFFGYTFMPISSIFSYQIEESLFENFIRIQNIILSFMLFPKCKNINFLTNYILICAVIAVAINFYQLRYVLSFIFAYSLFTNIKQNP